MGQLVTGSNQAKTGWRGENHDSDHSDSLHWVVLMLVFVASHLPWLHTIFLQNSRISSSSECGLPPHQLSGPLATGSTPQPQLIRLGWALDLRRAVRFSLVQHWDSALLGPRSLASKWEVLRAPRAAITHHMHGEAQKAGSPSAKRQVEVKVCGVQL